MGIIAFIIVLVLLVLVHEFGHFVAAKWSGMRVDEFGVGYPPRLFGTRLGETVYSINALPFGGFVKIYGEDADAAGSRSFVTKPWFLQAIVLIAGVVMNLFFAYLLLVGALALGTPRALSADEIAHAKNVSLAVAEVLPGSPADTAGIMAGDFIEKASDAGGSWNKSDPKSFTTFINESQGSPITLSLNRQGANKSVTAKAKQKIVPSDPSRYALGVSVGTVGVVPLSFSESVTQGARLTYEVVKETTVGLLQFFASVLTFRANLSAVSGPVGIAQAVGSASHQGLGDLLSLSALISINLAIVNLLPIPALDGGRLLFVLIEAVRGKKVSPKILQAVNAASFALLLLLMVVITVHDLYRIVG